MADVSGWLPNLLGPFVKVNDAEIPVRRTYLNITGVSMADNADADQTDLNVAPTVPGSTTQVLYNLSGALAAAGNATYSGGALHAVSPVITGTPVYQGARCAIKSVVGEVQTASTSQTTVASYTMADETNARFDAVITYARRTNVTKSGSYVRSVTYRRTGGGAPTIVGSIASPPDQETTPADDVTFDVSSNDVRARVTAADSDGRNWTCELRIQETLAT